VSALAMVELLGSATDALSTTTLLRILHSPNPEFPPPTIAAQLGVDNISAGFVPRPGPFQVPEPSSLRLALTVAIALAFERMRRRTRIRA
jgi:hypothetical protein